MNISTRGVSGRPEMTAALKAQTGLDDDVLECLVARFYEKARQDPLLGPVFARHVRDWEQHLERMSLFWSSVALMTGRYHGRPIEAHCGLGVAAEHFERWLELFDETAEEICPPAGAEHLTSKAQAMAKVIRARIGPQETGSSR
ncbi:MAG: group III truncated hemoglobin [Nitratireductor sp.]|nr:group III truncated hemoglobin [Nitratireductor sp.]